MINVTLKIILFAVTATVCFSQTVLDEYVRAGLESNLALRQHSISYDQSVAALHEAGGLFLPSVTMSSRYSRADGGRSLEVPIGDLMNPVYETLNEILTWGGYDPKFPSNLENESYPILPEEEQETKLRVIQPIFKPEILFNYRIKSGMREISDAERAMYARELAMEIRTAYFHYIQAIGAVDICEEYLELTGENLRVSRSLFDNGKVTEDAVFRAEARIAQLQGETTSARKDSTMAAAYFNFLLNREHNAKITVESMSYPHETYKLAAAESIAIANREELQAMESGLSVATNYARFAKSAFLPGLVGVFDYGFQGEEYDFDSEHDFWMASLILEWELFSGGQDWFAARSANLEYTKVELSLEELRAKILLQVRDAFEVLSVAKIRAEAAKDEVRAARESFGIIEKKYSLGMIGQIEYMEAQTYLSEAETRALIAEYDRKAAAVRLTRIIAADDISAYFEE